MKLIDTHCHLDFPEFDKDREAVIEKAQREGVVYIIDVGTNIDSSKKAIKLSEKFDDIFATVGIHPSYVKNYDISCIKELEKLAAKNRKVVGIGETGLDYHYGKDFADKQKDFFLAQADLAGKLNLPLIVHQRESKDDIMNIMEKVKIPDKTVLHCFGGDSELADYCLKKGIFISFTGIVTFPNAKDVRDVAKKFPSAHIMVETDAPFLSPVPYRGKRNEPAMVKYVMEEIANVKGEGTESFSEKVFKTTLDFFNIT